MKLFADYHVHTNNARFRKGKASIQDIAHKANAIGLSEVAVVCHGLNHFYACDKLKFLQSRKVVDDLNLELDTQIHLAIEADILSVDGDLDVDDEMLEKTDILMIGYHKMIKTDYASYFGRQNKSAQAIDLATDAYINAIKRYNVDIVAHPNVGVKLDLYKLGKFCLENDVLIELNNKHLNFSEAEANDLIRSGCLFVISSNSYDIETIGRFDNVMIFIEKYNIPLERVVNLDISGGQKTKLELEIEDDYWRLQKLKAKQPKPYELSAEIEDKLNQIIKEKNIIEKEYDEIDIKDTLSADERAFIEQVEEYLRTGVKPNKK